MPGEAAATLGAAVRFVPRPLAAVPGQVCALREGPLAQRAVGGFSWWVAWCIFSPDGLVTFPALVALVRFSPEWTRSCCFSLLGCLKRAAQWPQLWGRSSE